VGKRNATPEAGSYLRGYLNEQEKRQAGGTGANQHTAQRDQTDPAATAERLAREHKVSPATIKRDAKFYRAVEAIVSNCGLAARSLILGRDTGLTRTAVKHLAQQPPVEQRRRVAQLLKEGKPRRGRKKGSKPTTFRVPVEPKALVQTVLQQLGVEGLLAVQELIPDVLREAAGAQPADEPPRQRKRPPPKG
jgi:hypothetical protein